MQHVARHRAFDAVRARGYGDVGCARRVGRPGTARAGPDQGGGTVFQEVERLAARRRGLRRRQFRLLRQQTGPRVASAEAGVRQNGGKLSEVVRQAGDVKLGERGAGAIDRVGERRAGRAGADQLGEQWIEYGRRCVAEIAATVDPDAGARRLLVAGNGPGAARHHAKLHRMAARLANGGLVGEAERGERFATGDAELARHQVDPGDLLAHRMLDLDAGVALDEVVRAVFRREQELHRAGVHIVGGAGEAHGIVQDALAQRRRQTACGGDFDDLLIADLHGTVPLPQMQRAAGAVGEDLHLDVAWPLDPFLEEQRAVAEGLGRLAAAPLEGFRHRSAVFDDAHAAPTTARRRLHHDRIANRLRCVLGRLGGGQRDLAAGHHGNLVGGGVCAGLNLVAEQAERGR